MSRFRETVNCSGALSGKVDGTFPVRKRDEKSKWTAPPFQRNRDLLEGAPAGRPQRRMAACSGAGFEIERARPLGPDLP
jgi:hypothetical protein